MVTKGIFERKEKHFSEGVNIGTFTIYLTRNRRGSNDRVALMGC